MTYSVKEMYYTLQGEGAQAGRAAVFLRFAGCNLWSGREKYREQAVCKFCDTQFVGTDGENGGKFKTAEELARQVKKLWQLGTMSIDMTTEGNPYVVCTGGEPCLQLDTRLIRALHAEGFEVGVETNGTLRVPEGVDWICVSPKADSKIIQTSGDELKLVYPQPENKPEDFEELAFDNFFLSPRDMHFEPMEYKYGMNWTPEQEAPVRQCIEYCLRHPQWRLSLQTHKFLGLK